MYTCMTVRVLVSILTDHREEHVVQEESNKNDDQNEVARLATPVDTSRHLAKGDHLFYCHALTSGSVKKFKAEKLTMKKVLVLPCRYK